MRRRCCCLRHHKHCTHVHVPYVFLRNGAAIASRRRCYCPAQSQTLRTHVPMRPWSNVVLNALLCHAGSVLLPNSPLLPARGIHTLLVSPYDALLPSVRLHVRSRSALHPCAAMYAHHTAPPCCYACVRVPAAHCTPALLCLCSTLCPHAAHCALATAHPLQSTPSRLRYLPALLSSVSTLQA